MLELDRLVADAREGGYGRKVLAHHLVQPWHWPAPLAQVRRVARLAGVRRSPPRPGEVILVGVEDETRGWTWRLAPGGGESPVRLDDSARESLGRARGLALEVLPVVDTSLAEAAAWTFEPLGVERDGRPEELRGTSYGAAMFLAAASVTLGQTVSAEVAALAALGQGTVLDDVDGLEPKFRALAEQAPAVRRVVVALPQLAEARAIARRLRSPFRIEGVSNVSELAAAVFPDVTFEDVSNDRLEQRAEELFAFSVTRSSNRAWRGAWRGIAMHARALLKRARRGTVVEARLRAVLNVCLRHAGDERREALPSLEAIGGASVSRIVRLRYLAHSVQSMADGGFGDLLATVAEARRALPSTPREASSDELMLFGAAGRALARCREYKDASQVLLATCESWLEAGRPEDAAVPLCEFLRVQGIAGTAKSLERALLLGRAVRDAPRTNEISRVFLDLAVGRALVQQSHPVEGSASLRAALRGERMGLDEATVSAWRWLARVAVEQGHSREALRYRQRARAVAGADFKAIIALDAALEAGAVPRKTLERVARLKDFGHLARAVARADWAETFAAESPY